MSQGGWESLRRVSPLFQVRKIDIFAFAVTRKCFNYSCNGSRSKSNCEARLPAEHIRHVPRYKVHAG